MSEESHQIFEIDVERFDCKRSQCLFADKLAHSNSLINVQPEENCRIDELLCCSVGRLFRRQSNFEKCSNVGGRKKSAWTDLDRVSFEKIFKEAMFKSKNRRGQV